MAYLADRKAADNRIQIKAASAVMLHRKMLQQKVQHKNAAPQYNCG
jgi:sRNA-binding carbon storage regulator CsrA